MKYTKAKYMDSMEKYLREEANVVVKSFLHRTWHG
jgi:uncharacterized protein (DUF2164 family)